MVFSFYWQFPLLCRSLLVCWSPLYFCFYFPWLKICIQKNITLTNIKDCTAYVFFWKFYSFRSYIQVLNLFWIHFCASCEKAVQLEPLHVVFSFPNTIYWRDCPSLIVYSCLLCCRLIAHISVGSFLDVLFYSTDLSMFVPNHTVWITVAL